MSSIKRTDIEAAIGLSRVVIYFAQWILPKANVLNEELYETVLSYKA